MKQQAAQKSYQKEAIVRPIHSLPDQIARFLPETAFDLKQYPSFKDQLTDLVLANIDDENYGIAQLCRDAGISRSVLYRKLQAVGIRSVSKFIRSLRLQRAKTLLKQSDLSITQVAFEVGFKDAMYFSKVFSETVRMTPSHFRRSCRGK